jgi:hypothetical protein
MCGIIITTIFIVILSLMLKGINKYEKNPLDKFFYGSIFLTMDVICILLLIYLIYKQFQ